MGIGASGVKRFDTVRLGALVGALAPVAVFSLMAFTVYLRMDSGYFARFFVQEGTLGRMVSLATLSDAVLFFVSIYTHRLRSARGLLGATIVYAMVSIAFALTV